MQSCATCFSHCSNKPDLCMVMFVRTPHMKNYAPVQWHGANPRRTTLFSWQVAAA
jgi:hypothetical protein